ncbi:uberolysin/carnocyclin family circular bacteriocin, partial [Bacillus vallismortis]|nr:uberolysin/carnocyclin family circular bacteriocin [Bacillus vallismortis]
LIGIVTGAGAIYYAIVATPKSMIKKYGKKYAAAW